MENKIIDGHYESNQAPRLGLEQAFAETYHVLYHSKNPKWRAIPYSFRLFLHHNMDQTWSSEADFSNDLDEMDLLKETRALLTLTYRFFHCTDKEQQELSESERKAVEALGVVYKGQSLLDVLSSFGYQIPEYFNLSKYSIEELQANEMECFVRFAAERSRNNPARSRVLTPAELISYSLMDVRSLYSRAIKKKCGGWSCGTHTNNVRTEHARLIATKYSDNLINHFINLCATCVDARNFLQDANIHIKVMAEEFLSMRPEPCVHPPHSWWKKMLEEEK